MTSTDQTFCQKLLNYRLEKESVKLLITTSISKIGTVKTVELVYNFDQKNWFDFFTERSFVEDLLEELISSNEWYFVPSFNIEPANLSHWKFDLLVVFVFLKKNVNDEL